MSTIAETWRCLEAFAVAGDPPRVVAAGELVNDDDPVLRSHRQFFEPAGGYVDRRARPVEQATAAPGELRGPIVPLVPPSAATTTPGTDGGADMPPRPPRTRNRSETRRTR